MELFAEYRTLWLVVLGIVPLWLALKLLRYGLVFRAVYNTPFEPDRLDLIAQEQIPEDQRAVLASDAETLRQSGFELLCVLRGQGKLGKATVTRYSEIHVNPRTRTYAALRVNHDAWLKLSCVCDFSNYLRNGRFILTGTHALFIAPSLPARMLFEAPRCATVAERWQRHQARIAAHIDDSLNLSPAGGLAVQRASMQELARHLLHKHVLRQPSAGSAMRYTWRGAHAVTQALFAEIRRWQKFNPESSSAMAPSQEVQAYAHAQAFAQENKLGRLGKLMLLLVTAGLFSVAFGAVFSWELVPILLGVVLFHELGHFAAMKLFGYRDLSIFFIPLLGAATMGSKAHATPMQKVLVYLAGPVPGLLLGVLAWYGWTVLQAPTLLTLSIAALVLNLLNLLPFSPLDGGRIVEVLWFSRFPRVRVGFALLGALALAALALLFEDYFLGGLAVLLLTIIPGEWRVAQLIKRVREEGPAPEAELLLRIFTRMHEIYPPKTNPLTRNDVAKRVLESTQEVHPRLRTSVFGSGLYLASFLLPIMTAFLVLGLSAASWMQPGLPSQAAASAPSLELPDWEARLRAAKTPEAQWKTLIEAGDWYLEIEDPVQARSYFERALRLADTLPERDLKRAQTLLRRATATLEQGESGLADYREASSLLANPVGGHARFKAQALEGIFNYDATLTTQQKIDLLTQAIVLYEAGRSNPEQLSLQRLTLARLLDAQQDAAKAEQVLRAGMIPVTDPKQATASPWLITHLGWFLIGHGRAQEAVVLLTPRAASHQPPRYDHEVLAALAWAQNTVGQHKAALAVLERIPPAPSALPFLKGDLPIPIQLDIAATMTLGQLPGLDMQLQALTKTFSTLERRQRYIEQLEQRKQYDPWQANRWKAHQEILQQLPAS